MRAAATATIDGSEPLIAAFDDLSRFPAAQSDGGSWERIDGQLRVFERFLETLDPHTALRETLSRGAVSVSLLTEVGEASLQLVPLAQGRATRAERQAFGDAFTTWAQTYASYMNHVGDVWVYLDRHPQRSGAVLRALFAELIDEEQRAGEDMPLDEHETELVARHDAVMDELLEAFSAHRGDPYSLQELSRLVFDPLPAELEISLPAAPSTVRGFELDSGTTLTAGRAGLWQAWSSLAEHWLSPNPVVITVQALSEEAEFVLEDTLNAPRRAPVALVTGAQILAAFGEAMRGPEVFSATWLVPPPEDG